LETTFQKQAELQGLLTVTIYPEDYRETIRKALAHYSREMVLPGFRKGKVPAGLIKSRFGQSLLVEELNKLLTKALEEKVKGDGIEYIMQPLEVPTPGQEFDLDKELTYTFSFELVLRPDIDVDLSEGFSLKDLNVNITDQDVDQEILKAQQRLGGRTEVETADKADADYLFTFDVADVNVFADPSDKSVPDPDFYRVLTLYTALHPKAKSLLGNAKKGDIITTTLGDLLADNTEIIHTTLRLSREEFEQRKPQTLYAHILQIAEVHPHELNPDFFAKVLERPEGSTAGWDEAQFRNAMRERLHDVFANLNAYLKNQQVQNYLLERYPIALPMDLIYRILKRDNPDAQDDKALLKKFPNFETNLRYELLVQAVRKKYPDIALSTDEFYAKMTDQVKKQMNLDSLAGLGGSHAHTHDHAHEHEHAHHDHAHNHEHEHEHEHHHHDHAHDHNHAHKHDHENQDHANVASGTGFDIDRFVRQLINSTFQRDPEMAEKNFAEMSRQKFYGEIQAQHAQVATETVSATEFYNRFYEITSGREQVNL